MRASLSSTRRRQPVCSGSLLSLVVVVVVFLLCCTCGVQSSSSSNSNSNDPHPHSGKLTPFQPGNPKLKLNKAALQLLNAGKPYQTQTQEKDSTGGRGVVVQDIHAPPDLVWKTILNFDRYAEMVPKTVYSKNYNILHHSKSNKSSSIIIYTKMIAGFPFLKLTWYVKHTYYPKLNSLTWTLDYSKHSDLDDSVGYWYVQPHPDHDKEDSYTRLYYSVSILMFRWVPEFVVNFMTKKALTDATAWVKKYSELEYEQQQQQEEVVGQRQVSTTTTAKTKKKRASSSLLSGGWWFRKKQHDRNENEQQKQQQRRAGADDMDESAKTTTTTKTAKQPQESLGLARYALLTYVFCLGVYNVHLYVSQ